MMNRSMPPGVVVPTLAYPDVGEAVEWLCQAFGFVERLRIGDHRAQLVIGNEELGRGSVVVTASPAPPTASGDGVMVKVRDVDAHAERAREAGARIVGEPQTYPYGERQYTAVDPGGHAWTFSQAVEDVDPATWGGTLRDER